MKSKRPARRRSRSVWGRVAGYGSALLLVAAALVVLLVPMLEKRGSGGAGTAGAQGTPSAQATPTAGQPGGQAPRPSASGSAPRGSGGGRSGLPQTGGGPPMPGQGGSGVGFTWCPAGTAFYRQGAGGLEVLINVSGSGAVRAEVTAGGRAPSVQQATVKGGRPHTFRYKGVPAGQVQRVKVTTVSIGASMQSCYARPGT